jgi:hypothetical protein
VEQVRAARDPWTRRFLIGAVACFVLAILLFVVYRVALDSGASSLQAMVS